MPLYEYKCSKCGNSFEILHKVTDVSLKKCIKCGGPVKKLISASALQFKGSGWYVTDYAQKERRGKEPKDKERQKGEKKEDKKEIKKETKVKKNPSDQS